MGILIAIIVILLWLAHLVYCLLFVRIELANPWLYLHTLLQAYFYTGLFITGHDAMHGLISKRLNVNTIVGWTSSLCFAGLSYQKLRKNHYLHHQFPGTAEDPDFYTKSQNFLAWWFVFIKRYATIWQFLFMAIAFNMLKLWFNVSSLIVFWMLPAVLSTFQLFYVGTFLPHRKPHLESMKPHKARSQKGPHWWAMLSCYFFGYHWEHHENARVPWWQLYRFKDKMCIPKK